MEKLTEKEVFELKKQKRILIVELKELKGKLSAIKKAELKEKRLMCVEAKGYTRFLTIDPIQKEVRESTGSREIVMFSLENFTTISENNVIRKFKQLAYLEQPIRVID